MRQLTALALSALLAAPQFGQTSAQMQVTATVILPPSTQTLRYKPVSAAYMPSPDGAVSVTYSASETHCHVSTAALGPGAPVLVTVHCDAYAFPQRAITVTPVQQDLTVRRSRK